MVQPGRVKNLNHRRSSNGRYVVYWMQASQRAECNHALEYAIEQANDLGKPVVVYFGLTERYPEANARHYRFMLEGLKETQQALRARGINFVLRRESPELGIIEIARQASSVVVDRGYLTVQRNWRDYAAQRLECPLIQVETDAVVPVELSSPKEEYSAATLRPRIHRRLPDFLAPLAGSVPKDRSIDLDSDSLSLDNVDQTLSTLDIDRSVPKARNFRGGAGEANRLLDVFVGQKLDRYAELRNDPNEDCLSGLSPYLHFGQISPLDIALRVLETGSRNSAAFLEELIVRRELAFNFVQYNRDYGTFDSLPSWAQKTLCEHEADPRPASYSLEQLEKAKTHDPCWNAAQTEMMVEGKMHGYMRMYWGKKILEWARSPREAYEIALYLNNKHELDGRDPNSYAGVAWCFGKHDRPWGERPVFGTVRYMNDRGLMRRFDVERYVKKWAGQESEEAANEQ